MDFYALNTAPLNGYETQFMAGSALLALNASGNPVNADLCAGSMQIAMDIQGAGTIAWLGSGEAEIDITATGQAADVVHASGDAAILLTGDGEFDTYLSSSGIARINIVGAWGIPDVAHLHLTDARAPSSRIIKADDDLRLISVQANADEPRDIHASRDDRTIVVTAESALPVREQRTNHIQQEART